ncbi:hypothetical protein BDK51DRAFT_28877 [Blyttiomyces helicus]|uniref:Uncharacterized protein n=1 Tax=Blyttiomyces helicus TaxID=388810 RepID=A0A4P9WU16_9FUNG|nr:hypothetical protein BDK51DRAFT_28877 [Blyttiomyces helicus]|eukprot:RKO94606.1 hypothetical protein BDK51DRAFT_28877 [Blyttiomyces helicus]
MHKVVPALLQVARFGAGGGWQVANLIPSTLPISVICPPSPSGGYAISNKLETSPGRALRREGFQAYPGGRNAYRGTRPPTFLTTTPPPKQQDSTEHPPPGRSQFQKKLKAPVRYDVTTSATLAPTR